MRLINITTDDIYVVSLQTADGPVTWRPLTKDGAPLPPDRCGPAGAADDCRWRDLRLRVQAPPGRQTLWLEVRRTGGKWQAQGQVIVK